ncbi:hypothetical protein PRZ48_010101 [Zasmidium cellare]|uniref:Uncharacterized protein n=1 Tax=Zasmidium cellare TaxID=395010 RepID=A0ABR0EET8_ZASCE|nr:hypothetical protein PRZ48_010101 [Zasmidium cellare]
MEEGNMADIATASDTRHGVRHLTFMDLPGEIRNNIYKLYSESEGDGSSAHQPQPKPGKKKRKRKGRRDPPRFPSQQKPEYRSAPFRLIGSRPPPFFTPSIIRVNRQIRREYTSLIFRHATLFVDIGSGPQLWDRFVHTIGDDIVKEIAGLEIRNLPREWGFRHYGHITVSVALRNVVKPVTWSREDCRRRFNMHIPISGDLAMQVRAGNKIKRSVRNLQVEDGKRSLSRESLRTVLGYATVEKVHSDVAWLNRATQYCVMALWAVITLPVLMLSLLIRGGPATFVLPVVITVVFGCMIMGFHVLDWAPDGVEFLLECWDAEREKSDEIKYGKESLEGVN